MTSSARPTGPSSVWLGTFFFLMLGGTGAFVPFFALHLRHAGLDGRGVGLVLACTSAVQTVAMLTAGMLADRWGDRVGLIRGLLVTSILAVLAFAATGSPGLALMSLALVAATRAPTTVLVDAEVIGVLEDSGRAPETYGRLRLWGSLGFLALANVAGWVAGSGTWQPLALAAFMLSLTAMMSTRLVSRPHHARTRATSAFAVYRQDPALKLLVVAAALHGTGQFIYDVFLSTLIVQAGFDVSLTGPALAVAVGAEVLVMGLARRSLGRVEPLILVAVGSAAMAVRLITTAYASTPALLVALQALHGLGFGLWWVALVEAVRRRTPVTARSGSQAVVVAAAYGLGPIFGSLLGSVLLDTSGPDALFMAGAAAAAAGGLAAIGAAAAAKRASPVPSLV